MRNTEALRFIDKSLESLKDFQLATVASVLHSFSSGSSQRVLVADEVGLGKTVVARGVIAELLKAHLLDSGDEIPKRPLRVTYICSNQALAHENRAKLAVFKAEAQNRYVQEPSFSRLITTAIINKTQKKNRNALLEISSLTPATSFNLTQGDGRWDERMIILSALVNHSKLSHIKVYLVDFFKGRISDSTWWNEECSRFIKEEKFQGKVLKEFHRLINRQISKAEKERCDIDFKGTWVEFLLESKKRKTSLTVPTRVRACLRLLMAQSCSKSISADLFILDEFQRFKGLLSTSNDSDESIIARQVFGSKGKSDSKILLLSATPFKAYSQAHNDEEGDGHDQELQFLLRFLSGGNEKMLTDYQMHRHALQQQIISLKDSSLDLGALDSHHKNAIERTLQPYICRTERGQISQGYEELFKTERDICNEYFSQADIHAFKAMDDVGEALNSIQKGRLRSQLMEFYKAAPWALSFLSGYQFKKQLDTYAEDPAVMQALKRSSAAWLSRKGIESYKLKLDDAPHGKIRALNEKLFADGGETLLWVPPSLSHYPLVGCFKGRDSFSKTLLFSSWAVVPRALSGLISYEAERRIIRSETKNNYFKKHSPKIKFDRSSSLQGWSLIYPAKILQAQKLEYRTDVGLSELVLKRSAYFKKQLKKLRCHTVQKKGDRSGDRWYALAPFLLDIANGFENDVDEWLSVVANHLSGEKNNAQFKNIKAYLSQGRELGLGPMPDNLPKYLAYLSIASPAVCCARSWQRLWPDADAKDILNSATTIGFAAISLFNKAESDRVVHRTQKSKKYFMAVARYCAEGDFQAVVDEFGHLLAEQGLAAATEKLAATMSFSPSHIGCQFEQDKLETSMKTTGSDNQKEKHRLRCHYAVPLGNQKLTDEKGVKRIGDVRDAFNSPFRPFMLNSTSIGQEGLDFHWYCRKIVHWNLPANPIDIEQREGRINRYKSLLVRKRVAQACKNEFISIENDPWFELFNLADKKTESNRLSDLVPYWHYPEGDADIIRYVPMMPLSKDILKLENALKVLVFYRLAFGQPRQEELLNNVLHRNLDSNELTLINDALVINLAPLKNNIIN